MNYGSSANKVGQIIFRATELDSHGTWELNITWAQEGKGLDDLVGTAPEYKGIAFPRATVKKDLKHGVAFVKQLTSIGLTDGCEYAALISWGHQDQNPFILSVCPKHEFENTKKQVKQTVSSRPEIPQGIFKVEVLGNDAAGNLERIMKKFTELWGEDPTETLVSKDAVWHKKEGMRYVPLETPPTLPPVNKLLLAVVQRQPAEESA